jgi:hypothetical protein
MPGRTWIIAPDAQSLKERWDRLVKEKDPKKKELLFHPHLRKGEPGDKYVGKSVKQGLSERPERKYCADPDKVRAKLHQLLAEARAAESMPWDARTLRLHRTVFPQMSNWLPGEEAAQLRFQFETELERLKAA